MVREKISECKIYLKFRSIFKDNISLYEAAMKNKSKNDLKRMKDDIKTIEREIRKMVNDGVTESYITPSSINYNSSVCKYIKDNNLFDGCEISLGCFGGLDLKFIDKNSPNNNKGD